ncbi:MAG: hypothetical protein IPM45_14235 [Acidimicrobiales bacterium]|nr:hypothetical protein [Acidimicrobiales bacterium]
MRRRLVAIVIAVLALGGFAAVGLPGSPAGAAVKATLSSPTGAWFIVQADGSVRVSWEAVPGAAAYEVYLNGELLTTTELTNVVEQIGRGVEGKFSFEIVAVGADGSRSEPAVVTVVIQGRSLGTGGQSTGGSSSFFEIPDPTPPPPDPCEPVDTLGLKNGACEEPPPQCSFDSQVGKVFCV